MATLSAPKSLLFCCHGLLVVLVRCDSFVTLWYIIGPLTLLSFLVQRGYFWFMATFSAPKSLLFCCHGRLVVLVRCGSFVTLWYIIGPLTLLSSLVQRVFYFIFFLFLATLSAPKSLFFFFFFCFFFFLFFFAMDSWWFWYVAQCSFVTLWYIIGPLTLLSSLVQRGYFWFMATLYAPKRLLFVAMDSW